MRRPDLHLHTRASDGMYSADALAQLLQRADVTCFSVTDHDTMAGLGQAAQAAYDRGLAFIPGVELSVEGDQEIHILGYGVDAHDPALLAYLEELSAERLTRIEQMGERLSRLGLPLPMEEVLAQGGRTVGRPHLARAMVKMGYADSVAQAFERYLGRGCPAYIPREPRPASTMIRLLREGGAVPVLAHPGLLKWPAERLLPLLTAWQDAGLMGLEVYHPANKADFPGWDRLARQRGLLVTGGSDFHDVGDSHGQIGETISAWPTALEDAWALYRLTHR